ncbi:hypothetical protein GCM10007159_03000 [Modicisalibacter luteus]|nr:hypothetical protein GCM10007159_03000 [Halomonas lutea]
MDRLLLSALTLGCLSLALAYLSTQELGEPEVIAIQAVERMQKPGTSDIRRTSNDKPDSLFSSPRERAPSYVLPNTKVFEI